MVDPMGLIFVAIGLFSLAGALCDWDWYMNARKARFMVKILTRTGARIFYGVLGLALAGLGVLVTVGVLDLT